MAWKIPAMCDLKYFLLQQEIVNNQHLRTMTVDTKYALFLLLFIQLFAAMETMCNSLLIHPLNAD